MAVSCLLLWAWKKTHSNPPHSGHSLFLRGSYTTVGQYPLIYSCIPEPKGVSKRSNVTNRAILNQFGIDFCGNCSRAPDSSRDAVIRGGFAIIARAASVAKCIVPFTLYNGPSGIVRLSLPVRSSKGRNLHELGTEDCCWKY